MAKYHTGEIRRIMLAYTLDAHSAWMVREQVYNAKREGLDSVVEQLRFNGYRSIANAVSAEMTKQ